MDAHRYAWPSSKALIRDNLTNNCSGNAITRKSQVDLTNTITKAVPLHDGHTMIGAGGLFAPTIRYHNGTFFIICTNVMCEGAEFDASNFYITTDDIWAGKWSEPIEVELYGIDPSLYIDTDGRAYVQGSWRFDRTTQPTSTIKQWEIDLATGKRIGEIREIWSGFSSIYTEGPHIYLKDGWYYLLVAEGGTFEHHHLSMARSRDIWGPYESCPHNPVLTAEGKDEIVQDAGHGELFQALDGQWWAAVLGVRKNGDGTRYPLGRETFLTPVEWPVGEWPIIKHPAPGHFRRFSSTPSVKRPSSLTCQVNPRVSDCFIRHPVAEDYRWPESSQAHQSLFLRASVADLTVPIGTTTFVGKRQRLLVDSSASTELILDDTTAAQCSEKSVRAGLAIYKDDFRHVAISYDFATSRIILSVRNKSPEDKIIAELPVERHIQSIGFRFKSSLDTYLFECRKGEMKWQVVGTVDMRELTARDFTGTVAGVYACHQGETVLDREWVAFRDLQIEEYA